MSDVLWKLTGVSVRGAGPARLADVTVELRRGVTAVLGHSGAGKTSLLNLLVGFESPDRGTVVCGPPPDGCSLPVYWVPQNAGLWPHLTVREHLTQVSAEEGDAGAMAMLASLDIAAKAGSRPDELSQGERSRVAVARALVSGAAALVMDEPFVSVDPARVDGYWSVVREHIARTGASLVFATHSPKAVLAEAERVVCLKEGRLLYAGEVEELYWRPATRDLAECLGECNWLSPDEARLWLGEEPAAARCYRPEQLAAVPAADSPVVVQSARFKGAVAEAELKHEGSGRVRRFYHRPAANGPRPGTRIVLKVLASVLLAVLGCGGSQERSLEFREVHYWPTPRDGARVPAPRAVAIGHRDEVVVLDTAARVLVFDEHGTLERQWRMPDREQGNPEGACVLADGRIAVADTHYSRVVLFSPEGSVVGEFGRNGEGPGEFLYPVSIAQDDEENLYVCEYGGNDRVQKFTREGRFLLSFGSFGAGRDQFQRAMGVVWHAGRVYVADAMNNRVQVFADGGEFIGTLGRPDRPLPLLVPYDISIGSDAALYVVEYSAGRVSKVSLDGELLGRYGEAGRGEGQFHTPWGIGVDSKLRIRVADTGNRRIVELKP